MVEILYDNLCNLIKANESFFVKEFPLKNGNKYRIFLYRLASYTDFLSEGALSARGTMFETTQNNELVRLVSYPMDKFFNYLENPLTTGIDLENPKQIMLKEDGSLVSTFIDINGELSFKTKSTPYSEHAISFKKIFAKLPNEFTSIVESITKRGYTINMEYCDPVYRIIIPHQMPRVVILNIRSIKDGSYLSLNDLLPEEWQVLSYYWVSMHQEEVNGNIQDWVENDVKNMEGIEGYVIQTNTDQLVKVKTEWYVSLHRAKEDITNPKRLFFCVVDESIDDLKVMFKEDNWVQSQINDMENKVSSIVKDTVKSIDRFYQENKDLDRRSYAIKGQKELQSNIFSLAMIKYQKQEPDYKEFLKKNYKSFIGEE